MKQLNENTLVNKDLYIDGLKSLMESLDEVKDAEYPAPINESSDNPTGKFGDKGSNYKFSGAHTHAQYTHSTDGADVGIDDMISNAKKLIDDLNNPKSLVYLSQGNNDLEDAQHALEDLETIKGYLDENEAAYKKVEAEIKEIEDKQKSLKSEIEMAQGSIEGAQNQLDDLKNSNTPPSQDEIDKLNQEIESYNDEIADRKFEYDGLEEKKSLLYTSYDSYQNEYNRMLNHALSPKTEKGAGSDLETLKASLNGQEYSGPYKKNSNEEYLFDKYPMIMP